MMPFTQRDHDKAVELAGDFLLLALCLLAVCFMLLASCSARLTADDDTPVYDYSGPDGTLTGVPYQLRNYVVVDHDTGVYYFLIQDPETGNIALCPRLESDGTPWKNPIYVPSTERGE